MTMLMEAIKMRTMQIVVVSAIAVAAILVAVAVGYPDWMWLPLTVSFYVALLMLLGLAGSHVWTRRASTRLGND
jgi:hypothetical protein